MFVCVRACVRACVCDECASVFGRVCACTCSCWFQVDQINVNTSSVLQELTPERSIG